MRIETSDGQGNIIEVIEDDGTPPPEMFGVAMVPTSVITEALDEITTSSTRAEIAEALVALRDGIT